MTAVPRALIVDDEPLARRRLQIVLKQVVETIDIVGHADSCTAALAAIARLDPDIVLLDIRMRDGNGFDVLDRLPEDRCPAVIFVTAFDDSAIRAFDVSAVDYLLKPVDGRRLAEAWARAVDRIAMRDAADRLAELRLVVANLRSAASAPERRFEREFWIRGNGANVSRLEAAAIEWVVVEDDYVRLHTATHSYLMRESIQGLLTRLDPAAFVRIHRATIVRVSAIARVGRGTGGGLQVRLENGRTLAAGRVYARALTRRLAARHGPAAGGDRETTTIRLAQTAGPDENLDAATRVT